MTSKSNNAMNSDDDKIRDHAAEVYERVEDDCSHPLTCSYRGEDPVDCAFDSKADEWSMGGKDVFEKCTMTTA